ncbi:MAG: SusD/RagB family nutrient-binding outer membrane lipoprotein [Bacteroidia bacterium]|nr:SusD/RagB family nutrient-binding outer membrane lipoprotein [Bacteroidia bacterium]
MKISSIKLTLLISGMLMLSSCEKDFLDVNKNPNEPEQVEAKQILPTAIAHTAYVIGNDYQIIGGYWAQYWTQGPTGSQYSIYDQYLISNTTFDRSWTDLYSSCLMDLEDVVRKTENGNSKYAGVACILQAYIYQVLTDLHGDIPFSEALKAENGNYTPKYDAQSVVYDGLIPLIDKGIALIDAYSGDDFYPQEDDFLYHGDMDLWKKFANTLKLKIYMRQSEIRPGTSQAGIALLAANGIGFLSETEDTEMPFTDDVFGQNPFYMQIAALGSFNVLASNSGMNYLRDNNDPRIDVFYRTATSGDSAGTHNGINQGQGKEPGFGGPDVVSGWYSKPSFVIAGPESPVVFMSAAESYFLQAEAVARGWLAGNAKSLYESGITASFTRWGLDATDAATYYSQANIDFPSGGTMQDQVKAIVTQKWVSMNGTQSAEAWSEWRRTGYPDFLIVSMSSQIGNEFPGVLLYPNSEQTLNPNTPIQHNVKDKVWWDVN